MKALSIKGLEGLFPRIFRTFETDPDRHRHIRLKRLIASDRVVRARRRGDDAFQATLGDLRMAPAGDAYHVHHSGDVHSMFQARHRSLPTDFWATAIDVDQPFSRLVEIGYGVGPLLSNCHAACPEIANFVGLDLNSYASRRMAIRPHLPIYPESVWP